MGTEGGAEMSSRFPPDATVRYYNLRNGQSCDSTLYVASSKTPHWTEIAHFLSCVKGEAQPRVTLDESLIIARLLDGIYQSAETGREVLL
jgi:predicted dehydrogenase